jgi:hypothetical protein
VAGQVVEDDDIAGLIFVILVELADRELFDL